MRPLQARIEGVPPIWRTLLSESAIIRIAKIISVCESLQKSNVTKIKHHSFRARRQWALLEVCHRKIKVEKSKCASCSSSETTVGVSCPAQLVTLRQSSKEQSLSRPECKSEHLRTNERLTMVQRLWESASSIKCQDRKTRSHKLWHLGLHFRTSSALDSSEVTATVVSVPFSHFYTGWASHSMKTYYSRRTVSSARMFFVHPSTAKKKRRNNRWKSVMMARRWCRAPFVGRGTLSPSTCETSRTRKLRQKNNASSKIISIVRWPSWM